MKNVKIKVLAMFLAVCLATSMMVGCTPKDDSGNNSSGGSNQSSSEPKKPVNLIWITGGKEPKDLKVVTDALNEKSAKDIGVTVEIKHYSDQNKTKTALSSGEYYDMVFTCEWYNNFAQNAQSGYYADLTDKVQKLTPDLYKYIPKTVWLGAQVNNKVFAVPTYKDSASTHYWVYDKKLVVDELKYDISTIKTLDQLEPLLKAIKAKKPNEYPFIIDSKGLDTLESDFDMIINRSFGLAVKYGDKNYKVISTYDDPDYLRDLNALHKFYKAKYINQDALSLANEPKYSAVWSQQGFPGSDADWSATRGYETISSVKRDTVYSTSTIRGSLNAISANSKYIDEALKYLEYANTNKDYRNMLAYGIKDDHWKVNSEGTVEYLKDSYKPWIFAQASFFELFPVSPAPKTQWETLKEIQDKAPTNDLIGFTFDTKEFSADIAACQAIIDKYRTAFTCGAIDPAVKVPEMLGQLEKANYRKIIEACQKQVEAFLASKK